MEGQISTNNLNTHPPKQKLPSNQPASTNFPKRPKTNYYLIALGFLIVLLLATLLITLKKVSKQKPTLPTKPVSNKQKRIISTTPSLNPVTTTLTPIPDDTKRSSQTYQIPSSWLKYTDKSAGITIWYPPYYQPKYNPNRGSGFSYAAGSYLLDQNGNKLLDFFFVPYKGGSRRIALYKAWSFDGPYMMNLNKYGQQTISSQDINLNGKSWLVITTSIYAKERNEQGNRVFWLTAVGEKLFYFTYLQALEKKPEIFKTIKTIIATSELNNKVTRPSPSNYNLNCFIYPTTENKKDAWEAQVSADHELVIVQRTNNQLQKFTSIDSSLVEVEMNFQNHQSFAPIANFTISPASDQKGHYADAIKIVIDKKYVDKLIEQTPNNTPSISVTVKINGGIHDQSGKTCINTRPMVYFANKP